MNKIEKAILKTLAFFDLLGKPLTLEEIWQFLYKYRASKLQVLIGLKKLIKISKIGQKNTYYYLNNRQNIINDYLARQELIKKHWQKVAWVVRIIKLAPFIKNISIINSLSFNSSRESSDIDILVISKKGRLWTARALVVFLLEIIGQNKNKWFQAGKFCLGFAFDETRLNLNKLCLKEDIYFTYWLANLTPIYNRGIYLRLILANPWLNQELPNWQPKECKSQSSNLKISEKLLSGKLGDRIEKWLAKIQIKRIWQDPINKRKGASVIADQSMMKLHPYDKRKEYQKSWKRGCA